jgi:hypothetical protein
MARAMSDYDIGMKMVEEEELYLFFEAYEVATGEKLQIASSRERPDFLCSRPSGRIVGVELTAVIPPAGFWGDVHPSTALDTIVDAIDKKEGKRRTGQWAQRRNTILVLQLSRCPLSELAPYLEGVGPGEFTGHGFREVLIADHSELDAYGAVELFGLYPKRLWGHHEWYSGEALRLTGCRFQTVYDDEKSQSSSRS